MSRPLRIERAGGWYHITARGNERRPIFRDDRNRVHWCNLLGEMVDRFRVRLHAFVLMDNHYHLLVELTEPNLSRTRQWWAEFCDRHGNDGRELVLYLGRRACGLTAGACVSGRNDRLQRGIDRDQAI